MAKLILTFRGKPLQAYDFNYEQVTVGRDDTCTIQIDSLAVDPVHALINFTPEGVTVEQSQNGSAILVNGRKIESSQLADGDRITIGKHLLSYFDEKTNFESNPPEYKPPATDPSDETDAAANTQPANLQIQSGKNIGRMIPLKKALTKLGKTGDTSAVIAKRKDGYFLSSLDDGSAVRVNRTAINNNIIKLGHGDKIDIEKSSMQFFLED